MITRPVLGLLLAAAVAGCTQTNAVNEETARNEEPASGAAGNAAQRTGPDPELPRELAMMAQMLSRTGPLAYDGPAGRLKVVKIEVRGSELIHTVEYPVDLTPGVFEQLEALLPGKMCEADSQFRQVLMRGGRITYVMRDKDGEEFRTTVDRC
jgi:hypothetical protein